MDVHAAGSGGVMSIAVRHLPLAGAYNLRDIGGYRTTDGLTTRWGRLFRSDSLHALTSEAQEQLIGLGLRTVIDLRHEREVTELPNVFAASMTVRYRNVPLLDDRSAAAAASTPRSLPSLPEIYRRILDERRPQLLTVIEALAQPGALPAVVHCTAGKDRTGVVTALLLALAGVERSTIAEDYAATAERLAGPFMEEHRARTEAAGIDWESYQPLLGCPPEYMVETLAYLDTRHGGVAAYLVGCGIDRSTIAALRRSIIE